MPPKRKASPKSRYAKAAATRRRRAVPKQPKARSKHFAQLKSRVPKHRRTTRKVAPARHVEVDLPLVPMEARALRALNLMRLNGRSGVVAWKGDRTWLLEAALIVIAAADDPDVTLAEVRPTAEVKVDWGGEGCVIGPQSIVRRTIMGTVADAPPLRRASIPSSFGLSQRAPMTVIAASTASLWRAGSLGATARTGIMGQSAACSSA
jgi:hypothetical protein